MLADSDRLQVHRKRLRLEPSENSDTSDDDVPTENESSDSNNGSENEGQNQSHLKIIDYSEISRFKSIGSRAKSCPAPQPTKSAPSFLSFGISPLLLAALSSMSIKTPTEVQAACIPSILSGEAFLDFLRCDANIHAR
jgi:ATP-dependent RNA helicase DDX49/DBP8